MLRTYLIGNSFIVVSQLKARIAVDPLSRIKTAGVARRFTQKIRSYGKVLALIPVPEALRGSEVEEGFAIAGVQAIALSDIASVEDVLLKMAMAISNRPTCGPHHRL